METPTGASRDTAADASVSPADASASPELQMMDAANNVNAKGRRKPKPAKNSSRSSLIGRDNRSSFAFDKITPERFPQEWELFRTLDTNLDGFIEFTNLRETLESLGDLEKLDKVAEALECSSDKVIDFSDFVLAMFKSQRRASYVDAVSALPGAPAVIAEKSFYSSIAVESPMVVVPFVKYRSHFRLPRSTDGVTEAYVRLRHKIIFVSYRWLNADRNPPLPDDEKNTVYKTILKGVEEIMADMGWEEDNVALWIDYACVNQDDNEMKLRACESILGYVARCETMLVVAVGEDGRSLEKVAPAAYGARNSADIGEGVSDESVHDECVDPGTDGATGTICCFGPSRKTNAVHPENGRDASAADAEISSREEGVGGKSSPVYGRRRSSFRMKSTGDTSLRRIKAQEPRRKSIVIPVSVVKEESPAQWPPHDITDLREHWKRAWTRLEWLAFMCVSEIRRQSVDLYASSLRWEHLMRLSTGPEVGDAMPCVEWKMNLGELQGMLPSKGDVTRNTDLITIRQQEFKAMQLYHKAVIDYAVTTLTSVPSSAEMWLILSSKGLNSAAIVSLSEHLQKMEGSAARQCEDHQGNWNISLCTSLLVDENYIGDYGLARLINVFPYMKLSHLNIRNCDITAAGLEVISDAGKAQRVALKSLNCSFNNVGDGGASFIVDIISTQPVKVLDIERCGFDSMGLSLIFQSVHLSQLLDINISNNAVLDSAAVKAIGAACNDPRCHLVSLSANGCMIERNGAFVFASVISKGGNLMRLDIGNNDLQERGVKNIAVALASSQCSIEELNISSCGLSEYSAVNVTQAVASSPSLRVLDVSKNCFTAEGFAAFCGALRTAPALTKVSVRDCGLNGKMVDAIASVLQGPGGAHQEDGAPAPAFKVREMDARENSFSDDDIAALQAAVESGRTLLL